MKVRFLLLSIPAVFLVLNQVPGWCQEKYIPKEDEEIYGTWTNAQGVTHKIVNSTGGYKSFARVSDLLPNEDGTLRIDGKWTDSNGNIWYKIFTEVTSGEMAGWKVQGLDKISTSGTVWEHVGAFVIGDFDPSHYPTKIDPKDPNYFILYRAQE